MQPSPDGPSSHLRLQVLKPLLRRLPHDHNSEVVPPVNLHQQCNIPNGPERTRHALQSSNARSYNAVKVRLVRLPQIIFRLDYSSAIGGCRSGSWRLLLPTEEENRRQEEGFERGGGNYNGGLS